MVKPSDISTFLSIQAEGSMLRRILVVCVLVCAVAACAAETPRY